MQKIVQLFKSKIIQIFRYGLSPIQLSMTLSFGITLGLFPFIGFTSILCFIFALVFRLNWIVIQLVNWVVAPLQIVMLVPFYQMGEYFSMALFNNSITKFDLEGISKNEYLLKIISIVNSQISAVFGWLIICVPFCIIIYFTSLYFYKKYLKRVKIST